jgi:hypothetical protein
MNISRLLSSPVLSLRMLCLLGLLVLSTLSLQSQTRSKNLQDVIHLKNGWIIRGTIQFVSADSLISIETEQRNVFVFPRSEIQTIAQEARKLKVRRTYEPIPMSSGYYGTLSLGNLYGPGQFGYSQNAFSFSSSHGYRFHHLLAVGGGAGMQFYSQMALAPIFAEVRSVLRPHGASFYGYARGGYAFSVQGLDGDRWGVIESSRSGGWMGEYGVGIRMPTRRRFAWLVGLGMQYQQASEYYLYEWGETIERSYLFRRLRVSLTWEL